MPVKHLHFSVPELAKGSGLTEEEIMAIFTDGRSAFAFVEKRIIAAEELRPAPSKNSKYDAKHRFGDCEIRCLTRRGVSFAPSGCSGKGRKFSVKDFLEKLKNVSSFYIADIALFPDIPYWRISSALVLQWWQTKQIGKTARTRRDLLLKLLCV